MARDPLVGVYYWPPDYDGDVTCHTVWLENNYYDISRYNIHDNSTLKIEDDELQIGPKVLVEWEE